jgi:hypothetical protein
MEQDNQEYEFWYDEKGRVVGKQLISDDEL